MAIAILHQDQELVVVSKPSGLMVHRSAESRDRRFLLQEVRNQLGGDWLYPLHRLDRASSGIVVFARSSDAASKWQKIMNSRATTKEYLALVRGETRDFWEMDRALTNKQTKKKQPAQTVFEKVEEIRHEEEGEEHVYTLVRARLRTGRRHQIRRHLSKTRNQILGDTSYGKGRINRYLREHFGLPRMCLHAEHLALRAEAGGEALVEIWDPLPDDLQGFLDLLRRAQDVERAVENMGSDQGKSG